MQAQARHWPSVPHDGLTRQAVVLRAALLTLQQVVGGPLHGCACRLWTQHRDVCVHSWVVGRASETYIYGNLGIATYCIDSLIPYRYYVP